MPDESVLDVVVYPHGPDEVEIDFAGVNFVSVVNNGTWGKPAIIAPNTDDHASGFRGTVVYVNVANVAAYQITRRDIPND